MKKILKFNNELREITAPILVPDTPDWHGDTYSEEEVRKACRNFSEVCKRSNIQHEANVDDNIAKWVECYITPTDMEFQASEDDITVVKKGTWMGTMKIESDTVWSDVKKGRYTGFSIGCSAATEPILKGRKLAGKTGIDAVQRLSDFDFSSADAHVALVDEAANGTAILVYKSKEPKPNQDRDTMTIEEIQKKLVEAEAEKLELQKAKDKAEADKVELEKAKTDLEAEKTEIEKSKASIEAEKVELEKARDAEVKKAFVTKAKADYKNSVAEEEVDAFAEVLFKAKKALDEADFETITKALDKVENIIKNKEFLKDKGEGADGKKAKDADEAFEAVIKAIKKEKPQLKGFEVRTEARKQFAQESPELYAQLTQ